MSASGCVTPPRRVVRHVAAALLLVALGLSAAADARVIHKQRSLYQTILVTQDRELKCLKFSVRREQRNQTCVDDRNPKHMVFSYTRMMMAALLFNPQPQRILVVGLGGGTLPMALAELFPATHLDVVEIDPAVVEVASDYFAYKPGPKVATHVIDARVFTKRLARRMARDANVPGYDLILLDAFNGEYIPEHLMTREYFAETASILSDDGLVVANTFAISRLYDHESVTFEAVFGPFINLKLAQTGNRVMFAAKSGVDLQKRLLLALGRIDGLNPRLRRYDIDLNEFADELTFERDWDTSARVLTDEYNPANLLSRQRR